MSIGFVTVISTPSKFRMAWLHSKATGRLACRRSARVFVSGVLGTPAEKTQISVPATSSQSVLIGTSSPVCMMSRTWARRNSEAASYMTSSSASPSTVQRYATSPPILPVPRTEIRAILCIIREMKE